jgi:hypothetical protein
MLVLLGFIARQYFLYKKDAREGTKSDRESESGIVETTNAVLSIVRAEMVEYKKAQKEWSVREDVLEKEIVKLKRRVSALEEENANLKSGSR